MKDGVCPKCGGTEVFANSHDSFPSPFHQLPISAGHTARLEFHVCVECGYAESYVVEAKDRLRIRDYWSRVAKVPSAPRERGNLPRPATPPGHRVEQLPRPVKEAAEG